MLWQFYHLMELRTLKPLLCMRDRVDEISPINFLMIMDMPEDSSFFCSDNFRLVITGTYFIICIQLYIEALFMLCSTSSNCFLNVQFTVIFYG